MNTNDKRLFRALEKQGVSVTREGSIYTIRSLSVDGATPAEILLPAELPLESKAVIQLANLAACYHPDGGRVCRSCASPDFHPGDSGVAIGSVVENDDLLIPQATGKDVNCGMRLHVSDISLETFLSKKDQFVSLLKGDYILGTRDIEMDAASAREMFLGGNPAWALAFKKNPRGRVSKSDLDQIWEEQERVHCLGSLPGSLNWVPDKMIPNSGYVRDDGLATIGRGNHFVEVQVIEEVLDGAHAHLWGVRKGQLSFMIHSGSRNLGRYIGGLWEEKARENWPKVSKYPESGIFALSWKSQPELCAQYLEAENTASNYGFMNRLLLAELLRLRLREVFGPSIEAPLVYDLPHNITLRENGKYVTRKGACPAHEGLPVIIPGSMGTSSFLCVGLGNDRFISSASHGAGRAKSRGEMGHGEVNEDALGLRGVECITLRDERRVEEAPSAYKPIQPVIDSQVAAGTIKVVARMRPILTFKA